MKKQSMLFLLIFSLTSTIANAGTWGVLGGLNIDTPAIKDTTGALSYTSKASSGMGFGISHESNFLGVVGLEIDALYIQNKFDINIVGVSTNTYIQNALQIPVIARFYLLPIFDIGVGAYYEIGMPGVNVNGVDHTYGDENMKNRDYGLVGSLRMRFHIAPRLRLVIDGRYNYGLNELTADTSTNVSIKNRNIQALAGVSFAL